MNVEITCGIRRAVTISVQDLQNTLGAIMEQPTVKTSAQETSHPVSVVVISILVIRVTHKANPSPRRHTIVAAGL
jgi:hypothetical protein